MRILIFVASLAATMPALAQAPAPAVAQKGLAATLNVYVFPTTGQEPTQQSQDEAACYSWAVQNTGSDPFDSPPALLAAIRGAAWGALIAEIADDDPGKGAAYGAAAGAVSSRRRARRSRAQAEQQIEEQSQQNQQLTAQQLENFKKAFSVCLEAKSYMVRSTRKQTTEWRPRCGRAAATLAPHRARLQRVPYLGTPRGMRSDHAGRACRACVRS